MRERTRRFTCLHIAKEPSSNGYLSAYISSEEMYTDANTRWKNRLYPCSRMGYDLFSPTFAKQIETPRSMVFFHFKWFFPANNLLFGIFCLFLHRNPSLPKRWTFLYIPPAPHSRPHIAQYATSLEQEKPHPQETSRARIIYKCIPTGQYNTMEPRLPATHKVSYSPDKWTIGHLPCPQPSILKTN